MRRNRGLRLAVEMVSRKNRRRNANRKSPKTRRSDLTAFSRRFGARFQGMARWIDSHRVHAAVAGFALLFVVGLAGGFIVAAWLETKEEPSPKYASIEDLLSKLDYSEAEPGPQRATVEEKAPPPRPAPAPAPPQVAT